MIRKGLIIAMLIAFSQGPALAQGWLDSVFGSGGLGLWNSGVGQQWNSPQFYGGSQVPGAPGGQMYGEQPLPQVTPGAAQQGYAPQAQGYPQVAPSYSQQGIYSDWHADRSAPVGPQQGQYAQPPQQYQPPQQVRCPTAARSSAPTVCSSTTAIPAAVRCSAATAICCAAPTTCSSQSPSSAATGSTTSGGGRCNASCVSSAPVRTPAGSAAGSSPARGAVCSWSTADDG